MDHADEVAILGDAELVARSRDGQDESYAELFRRHQPAALGLARTLTDHSAADDIVAEAFEKLLLRIRGGGGPESAFRPYLMQTVRTVAVDASRRTSRLVVADERGAGQPAGPSEDSLFDTVYEHTTLARAFAALPERWQTFLWMSFVEGADRGEIATVLGINPGGVSALGYRAREGLRRAYLDAHLVDAPTDECGQVWPLLSGAVRGGLSPAQRQRVDEHVAECDYCRAALIELDAVNTRLGALIAPLVLGAAAPAYLAAVGYAPGSPGAAGSAGSGALTDAAGGSASPAGGASLEATRTGVAAKSSIAGLLKFSATGAALLAGASMLAVVGLIAVFTAPLGSERADVPLPGLATSDGTDEPEEGRAPDGTGTGDEASSVPGETTSGGATTSLSDSPTASTTGIPTGDPSATGVPTATSLPTGTGTVTPTGTPTAGPTTGPTTRPSGTRSPTPTQVPTSVSTTSPTGTGNPSPTPTPADEVDARLGNVDVTALNGPGPPIHVAIPVTLSGGTADLVVDVSVVGLTNYQNASAGNWSCAAITPMGGNAKTATVRCRLAAATPSDPLTLGLDIAYVGDASLTAQLTVEAPAVDVSGGDSTSTDLPPT